MTVSSWFSDPTTPRSPSGDGGGVAGPSSVHPSGVVAVPNPTMTPPPPQHGDGPDLPPWLVDHRVRARSSAPLIFRDGVLTQMIRVLLATDCPNPLLVGPAGVGKTAVVAELARRINRAEDSGGDDPDIPGFLCGVRVWELSLTGLAAGTSFRGDLEQRVESLIALVTDPGSPRVLVFVDEIHQLLQDRTLAPVAEMFKPHLARGAFSLIGATTTTEARAVADNPALARRFTPVRVEELTREQTAVVVGQAVDRLRDRHGLPFTVDRVSAEALVRIADTETGLVEHRPANALKLVDLVVADKVVRHHRARAFALRRARDTGQDAWLTAVDGLSTLPLRVDHMTTMARVLATGGVERTDVSPDALRDRLAGALRGQDRVVDEVAAGVGDDVLARMLDPDRRTPQVWLFVGASGVGKTTTAHIMAQCLTGRDPVVLAMAEYAHASDVSTLLGSPPGYVGSDSVRPKPLDALVDDPHRVLVLDEFDRAHTEVRGLFLSAFDTGVLTCRSGQRIDLSHTTVVCTTNAGHQVVTAAPVGFTGATAASSAPPSARALTAALEHVFSPEMVGRIAHVVAFDPMDQAVFATICADRYHTMRTRAVAALGAERTAGLPAQLPADVLADLVDRSWVPALGARPADPAVTGWITARLRDHALSDPIPAPVPDVPAVGERDTPSCP